MLLSHKKTIFEYHIISPYRKGVKNMSNKCCREFFDDYDCERSPERREGCRDIKEGVRDIREGLRDIEKGKVREGVCDIKEGLRDIEEGLRDLGCK